MSDADAPEAGRCPATTSPSKFRIRQAKRQRLLDEGLDPYPVAVPRTHSLAEVRAGYPELAADTATGDRVGVTGRVVFSRNSGKLCFATLQEGDGPSCRRWSAWPGWARSR